MSWRSLRPAPVRRQQLRTDHAFKLVSRSDADQSSRGCRQLSIKGLPVRVFHPQCLDGLVREDVVPIVCAEPPIIFSLRASEAGSFATITLAFFSPAARFFALIAKSSRLNAFDACPPIEEYGQIRHLICGLCLGFGSRKPTIVFKDGGPFLEVRTGVGPMRNTPPPFRKKRNIRNILNVA